MSKSESRRMDQILKLRCSEEDAALIKKKAEEAGMSTSELLRRSALNRKIMTRTDLKLMNELLRLGGLQKHLFNQLQANMTTDLSRQFSDVLVEIKIAVNALDLQQAPVSL